MNRRTFLVCTSGTIVALATPMWFLHSGRAPAPINPPPTRVRGAGFSVWQWQTLATVQEHLLPSEPRAPGAQEINAIDYLRRALTDPKLDPAVPAFIQDGVTRLERVAQTVAGRLFSELSVAQRETALRRLEGTPEGERWLTEMLGYIFEALLGDPVYGGNPNGIGWAWLGHQAGLPRPPANKRYFLL